MSTQVAGHVLIARLADPGVLGVMEHLHPMPGALTRSPRYLCRAGGDMHFMAMAGGLRREVVAGAFPDGRREAPFAPTLR